MTNYRKSDGKQLEADVELVYRLLSSRYGSSRVTRDVQLDGPDGQRQIDVLLECEVAGIPLRTIVECRDYRKRLDVTHVDGLHSKMRDVLANKAVLVSRRGFSKAAANKARRLGIGLCTLNDPAVDLQDVGSELPIVVREISLSTASPQFERYHEGGSLAINVDELVKVNDRCAKDRLIEDVVSGHICLDGDPKSVVWQPDRVSTPHYIRDGNGEKVVVSNYKLPVLVETSWFFGYASSLGGSLRWRDLSAGKNHLFVSVGDLFDFRNKLMPYKNRASLPEVPGMRTLSVAAIDKKATKVTGLKLIGADGKWVEATIKYIDPPSDASDEGPDHGDD